MLDRRMFLQTTGIVAISPLLFAKKEKPETIWTDVMDQPFPKGELILVRTYYYHGTFGDNQGKDEFLLPKYRLCKAMLECPSIVDETKMITSVNEYARFFTNSYEGKLYCFQCQEDMADQLMPMVEQIEGSEHVIYLHNYTWSFVNIENHKYVCWTKWKNEFPFKLEVAK